MEIVFTVLILLLTVAISSVVARVVPFHIPLPIMQIAIGALLGWSSLGLHIAFDPEVFMLLFIPPLLFVDGLRIPKRDFFKHQFSILMMSFGLVLFTVLFGGLFVNWLIPVIPLPAAFALAAVLSPTDAVALSGIVGRGRIPKRMMGLLEGEALTNDASGLVALKFAVAAMVTGSFSLPSATISFFVVAVGGVVVGGAISWLSTRISRWAFRFIGEDPATEIVLLLMMPFVVYIVAEKLGVSGILAAVVAGIVQSYNVQLSEQSLLTRLRSESVWSMLEFVFNGMVFILLGLQLPLIMGHLPELTIVGRRVDIGVMMFCIVAVGVVLMALRFAWVWFLARLLARLARRRNEPPPIGSGRNLVIVTLAGVRGAVTLAGVLSIPLLLQDGSPFPARGALIFLAAGVILFSILCAAIFLPLLMRGSKDNVHEELPEVALLVQQRTEAALSALDATRKAHTKEGQKQESQDAFDEACVRVMAQYHERASLFSNDEVSRGHLHQVRLFENQLQLTALRAERTMLYRLRSQKTVDEELLREQLSELDLAEIALIKKHERMSRVDGPQASKV